MGRLASSRSDFDYIIIGGGSAGCVLANKLSADGSRNVLLIEAGGRDVKREEIINPVEWPRNWGSTHTNYNYTTVPQRHAGGRQLAFDRGKVLGGSSSINAMIWLRGDPVDYRYWEEAGGPNWSQAQMLRTFRDIETFHGTPSRWRGSSGPIPAGQLPTNHPYANRFVEAGVELGFKRNHDFNGESLEGVGFYDMNVDNGRRVSAAEGFVLPVLQRRNLTLLSDSRVIRLLFVGKACRGIETWTDGDLKNFTADEIILSAGAVNSPELLLRSGIGPADELRSLGIEPIVDLPGVGRNFVDHLLVQNTVFTTKSPVPPPTGNTSEAHALWKSDASLEVPDIQLIFEQIPLGNTTVPVGGGYTVLVGLVRPSSAGTLRLRDSNPLTAPLIDPNYLAEEADFKKLLLAMEMAREVGNAEAFADVRDREFTPGGLSERDMRNFIAQNAATFWHPVGSCRLGTGADAVVDPECRVYGIEGLRVADASIMPRITTANTNAPTIMIGHRAAEIILGAERPQRSTLQSA